MKKYCFQIFLNLLRLLQTLKNQRKGMSFIKVDADHDDIFVKAASASVCARKQDRTKGSVCHTIGKFHVDFEMTAMQRTILERLVPFYTEEIIDTVLRPVIEQHTGWPSIRVIDWLLTNFAKSRRVVCTHPNGNERLNVFLAYKAQLSFFRRRNFDAFRRRLRVTVQTDKGELHSTVAQLNFYAWAHQTGILDWCRRHTSEIERDMVEVASRRKNLPPGKRRRAELSSAPRTKVAIYEAEN